MPKIVVEIEWKRPEHPYWMNPDNVALCLHAHVKGTKFEVRWARGGDPWKTRKRERKVNKPEKGSARSLLPITGMKGGD